MEASKWIRRKKLKWLNKGDRPTFSSAIPECEIWVSITDLLIDMFQFLSYYACNVLNFKMDKWYKCIDIHIFIQLTSTPQPKLLQNSSSKVWPDTLESWNWSFKMIEFRLQSLSFFFFFWVLILVGMAKNIELIISFFSSSCKEKGKGKTNRRPPSPTVKDGNSTKK